MRHWSDLRVFLAVLRNGSTLAASRLLGMAQPTVSRRIDALENETGVILFDRDTRGFRPTAAALTLVPMAEAMERAAAELTARISELTSGTPIRITAISSNFTPSFSRIISAFEIRHPEVRFEYQYSNKLFDIMAGETDIALRIGGPPPHPDLICRKISTARFTLYGSPAYARLHGLPDSPDDLRGHKVVQLHRDPPGPLGNWLSARVTPDQVVRTFGEIETLLASIRAGVGLGMDNLRRAADDPEMVACFDPPPELDHDHVMLVNPDAYRRPEVRAFTRYFAPRYAAVFKAGPGAK